MTKESIVRPVGVTYSKELSSSIYHRRIGFPNLSYLRTVIVTILCCWNSYQISLVLDSWLYHLSIHTFRCCVCSGIRTTRMGVLRSYICWWDFINIHCFSYCASITTYALYLYVGATGFEPIPSISQIVEFICWCIFFGLRFTFFQLTVE